MTSGDEGRAMPPAGPQEEGQAPPAQNEQPNLFKPISMENRITGNHRRQHRRVQGQPMPGSSYGFYDEVQAEGPVSNQRVEDGFSYLPSPPQDDTFSPYAQTTGSTGFYPPVSGVGQPYATGSFAAPEREPGRSTARFAPGESTTPMRSTGMLPPSSQPDGLYPVDNLFLIGNAAQPYTADVYPPVSRPENTHPAEESFFTGHAGQPYTAGSVPPSLPQSAPHRAEEAYAPERAGQPYAAGSFALPEREPDYDTARFTPGERTAPLYGTGVFPPVSQPEETYAAENPFLAENAAKPYTAGSVTPAVPQGAPHAAKKKYPPEYAGQLYATGSFTMPEREPELGAERFAPPESAGQYNTDIYPPASMLEETYPVENGEQYTQGTYTPLAPEAQPGTDDSGADDPWVALGWKAPKSGREETPPGRSLADRLPVREESYYTFPDTHVTMEDSISEAAVAGRTAPSGRSFAVRGGTTAPFAPAGENGMGGVTGAFSAPPTQPYPAADPFFTAQTDRRAPQDTLPFSASRRSAPYDAVPPAPPMPPLPPEDRQGPPEMPHGEEQPHTLGSWMRYSWRMALLIACALAIGLAGIEVAKMVGSLMTNEKQVAKTREEYFALAGVGTDAPISGVELLPAGQTYAPTATPQVVRTPTPAPRINQNDPLIGVLDGGNTADTQAETPTATTAARSKLTQYPDNPLLNIRDAFTKLRQQNGDVIGLLTIDGVLEETVVQRNNTYYLTHNARGLYGAGGAIFVDESITLKKPPENLLLRGQVTVEGKLFAPLMQYGQSGTAFIAQHGIIRCDTIYEEALYVVFAVIHADSNTTSGEYFNYGGYTTFQNDSQMLSFVQNARAHSICNIDVDVQATDRLLTLACVPRDGETASWVLLCRKLRSGETAGYIQKQ